MTGFSHLDAKGRARMVDVGDKAVTRREAAASGAIHMSPAAMRLLRSRRNPKGDVFAAAVLAGTLAAKRVDEIIPLCHSTALDAVEIAFSRACGRLGVRARVRCQGRTGVEMEALTAAAVALLTVYDMCKSVDKAMTIGPIRLEAKSGGRSGTWWRGRRT